MGELVQLNMEDDSLRIVRREVEAMEDRVAQHKSSAAKFRAIETQARERAEQYEAMADTLLTGISRLRVRS